MHFSSMAVSVLAQSVPLLAVGHLAGWKTREERSWLQRRRLLDALLVGFHDKKGMIFDKRVGVHDKQDDVTEKELSGSARREASVECDPLSKVNDAGIFNCGMDSHCVESEESDMGGFCVASKQAPSVSRALQAEVASCGEVFVVLGFTCDCSQLNSTSYGSTSYVGSFNCTGEYCLGVNQCTSAVVASTYYADGSFKVEICDEYSGVTALPFESYCISLISDLNSTECAVKIDDVLCNSCEFENKTCPNDVDHAERCCHIVDCTNTVAKVQGNSCDLVSTDAPNASPSETLPPATTDQPTVPLMTDAPATSSGSSHAAKVTMVVSAAATALMASFGT